jgi:hypothetical protein
VNIAVLVCEEAELAAVQGADPAVVQDAKTGREAPHVAARKSRAGTDAALGPGTQTA